MPQVYIDTLTTPLLALGRDLLPEHIKFSKGFTCSV